ncbi:hypothetical protein SS1G_12901 [Sclerotinia sclerotiorum 1980 UF-70]|uniref:Methyltransferase domain-containing protein n=1 Tax=Sclerotinia sclerotiorum (strain ATCC 18683 / 1980 / Ss-1) TaxID=665079 RepID=A7F5M3_SCLS1|nr:hypothetical protein SS1G_12901 [Sclerotinia sclerotiorum 1980 UF-70]EDN98044.1 hypothetical protein SS1G_12901 [Sclerotinia sclerotiorum 1980 UF-70]
MSTIAPEALAGFSDASSYDKHRPSYPLEALTILLRNLGVENVEGARIIDVGAGTGKFTSLLAQREEGFEILCVEPHEEMREVLRGKFGEGEGKGKVRIVEGHAAGMEVQEGWADAVIASQSVKTWRSTWADLEHRRLYDNTPRDGRATATKWEQVLKDIVESTEDGLPRFRNGKWKQVFEDQLDSTPLQTLKDTFMQDFPQFSLPLGEDHVEWTAWLSDEAIWNRFGTLSAITVLEPEKKEQIKQKVLNSLKELDAERNEKGEVALHGKTYFFWTSRV